jgi:hypothetical protein
MRSHSGDRVHWFRAEAELYRWLEQLELKHADFERSIQAFGKTEEMWTAVARTERDRGRLGHAAFAGRQAKIYNGLRGGAEVVYWRCGVKGLIDEKSSGKPLWKRAESFREAELKRLPQMVRTNCAIVRDLVDQDRTGFADTVGWT